MKRQILFLIVILFFVSQCSVKSQPLAKKVDEARNMKTIKDIEQDFEKATDDFSPVQNRMQGEYLVQTKSGKKDVIYDFLKQYKVLNIKKSSEAGFFIVNIEQDPGPQVLETASKKFLDIKSVQPNFLYKGF